MAHLVVFSFPATVGFPAGSYETFAQAYAGQEAVAQNLRNARIPVFVLSIIAPNGRTVGHYEYEHRTKPRGIRPKPMDAARLERMIKEAKEFRLKLDKNYRAFGGKYREAITALPEPDRSAATKFFFGGGTEKSPSRIAERQAVPIDRLYQVVLDVQRTALHPAQ